MGRLTATYRPDSSTIEYAYDKNGNLTVLINPLSISHDFTYNGVDYKTSCRTPLNNSYQYIYDRDRRMVKTIFPSTREIDNNFTPETLTYANATELYTYDNDGLLAGSG